MAQGLLINFLCEFSLSLSGRISAIKYSELSNNTENIPNRNQSSCSARKWKINRFVALQSRAIRDATSSFDNFLSKNMYRLEVKFVSLKLKHCNCLLQRSEEKYFTDDCDTGLNDSINDACLQLFPNSRKFRAIFETHGGFGTLCLRARKRPLAHLSLTTTALSNEDLAERE